MDRESGQALVETIITVPLILVLILGINWVGLLGKTKIVLTIATREAAREFVLDSRSTAANLAKEICAKNLPVSRDEVKVNFKRSFGTVTVSARVNYETPFKALSDEQFVVSASTTMPKPIFSYN